MCINSNKKLKTEVDHKILTETAEIEFEDEKGDSWAFSDYEDSDSEVFIKEEDCNVCKQFII